MPPPRNPLADASGRVRQPPTIRWSEIVAKIARDEGMTQQDAAKVVGTAMRHVEQALVDGRTVSLPRIGRLRVLPRKPGWCFAARFPPSRRVRFTHADAFRKRLDGWRPRWDAAERRWAVPFRPTGE